MRLAGKSIADQLFRDSGPDGFAAADRELAKLRLKRDWIKTPPSRDVIRPLLFRCGTDERRFPCWIEGLRDRERFDLLPAEERRIFVLLHDSGIDFKLFRSDIPIL
jgi:hypothetical protein